MAEIVVEISTPKNQSVFFPPVQQTLRGAWVKDRLQRNASSDRGLMEIPDTPGIRVHLNIETRVARITDPLLDPENVTKYDELKIKHKAVFGETRGWPEVKYKLPDANAVKTWFYWMQRLCSQNQAILREGDFTKKVPGRARTSWGATTTYEREEEMKSTSAEETKRS